VLVTAQLALTAVLLVVAGLLLRSFATSRVADVGFRTEGLALVAFDTSMVRYSEDRTREFWADALARVRALPGVQAAALVSPRLPFDINFSQMSIRVDGHSYADSTAGDVVANVEVSPGYFDTLEIPLVAGRLFTDADRAGSPLVAIVNDTMARKFWPGSSALGRTFSTVSGKRYEVVGIVRNHTVYGVGERPTPYLHLAAAQQPSTYNCIVARAGGDAAATLAAMRRELLEMEPGLVFVRQTTMDASLAASLLPQRLSAMLAGAFGGLGTLLAAIGLYGVIAYSVARRTREIGIRIALGADSGRVLRMVMREGLTLAATGAAVGGLLAAVAARLLGGVLFGVTAADPLAWGGAIGTLFLAAVLANYLPARRAMSVNPITALRRE
jgi:predicted permease